MGRKIEAIPKVGDNVMKTIQIDYPESIPAALNLTPECFEEEARLALAIKLFELGRLTSGQAAKLAGIPRVTFLLNCHRYGASTVAWDGEEIQAEFKDSSS
jgi:predicted HTH domain antitoxin